MLAELAELARLSPTTVGYYVREHLIRPLERRGTLTRYDRHQLMLLLGIVRLKPDGESTLAEKKRKLEAMGDQRLERWLRAGPLPPAAAAALGFGTAPLLDATEANSARGSATRRANSPEGATGVATPTATVGETTVEHWERITLLPGLELMLRADAKPAVRAVLQRIRDECAAR